MADIIRTHAELVDAVDQAADVLKRTRGNLTYAAELIGRLTTEED